MHTAFELKPDLFDIAIDGRPAEWRDLLPGWHSHDRFGIVVTGPLGALGANLLIQIAILAYYDSDPGRRGKPARYPDIYLFHVGGRFGDVSAYDFWPPRKEVFLPDEPAAVLEALNDHGISRLAVPDGAPAVADFAFKEPASALERIASAFAYHPAGAARDADVVLRGRDPILLRYAERVLYPEAGLARARAMPTADDRARMRDRLRWIAQIGARRDEVAVADRDRAAARLRAATVDGLPVERLRRIPVAAALDLLVARAE
ncbi:hypothetical protein [Roseomonas sp. 18066]|uniref:hypothetical protein n=1 Tax=Roseomonas sp. 18066 TaxID=2681412 RepID=UPI00135CB055|nr:hypothetical protein [Roseomonas sp. 18066]